jgi:hypothetical protein
MVAMGGAADKERLVGSAGHVENDPQETCAAQRFCAAKALFAKG